MRALITGGAGFVGSHLTEALLNQNAFVTVIDDLSTGSITNIRHLKGRSGFSYVIDTVMDHSLMAELVDAADVIYHLAAAVGVRLIVESPVRTIETNVSCTEAVLTLAAKKQKKVLIASTSEVYGKSTAIPFREDGDLVIGNTTRGRWSYACSKTLDEFLGLAYWKEKKVPVVVFRLFNTVGPRQTGRYGMVLPTFVQQALKNESITVYGDGQQSRCFTWVGDAVRAIIDLSLHPQAVGQVFNIGSEQEVTIMDLAKMVRDVARSSSEITLVPYDQAYEEGFEDMGRRVPDLSKIRNLIGYKPTVDLPNIVAQVVEYYRQQMLG
ncbi:MAG: dTDP-glucose 4,6-dehydratase [Nitrospira sp.]|jgi:UDP-glucose 4-epimerase|nr:MAG: dTDP-glucose 4,6-dehydratase [Nitrospira sp.]